METWSSWHLGSKTIISQFEDCVTRCPSSLALKQGERSWTYAGLDAWSDQVANGLLKLRGPKAEPVALFLPQGAEAVAAMLAVLKAGKFYIPLDPAFPAARNNYILNDSQANLVICSAKTISDGQSLSHSQAPVCLFEDLASRETASLPSPHIDPKSLAYIIYTSGSTGKPKGVYQNHFGVVHNALRQVEKIEYSSHDRSTLLYSPSVMGAVRDIYNNLFSGSALYPFDLRADGMSGLANFLCEEKISILHTIASVFRHFARDFADPTIFESVRLLFLGGEAVLQSDYAAFERLFPATSRLVTGLGSTETGTVCVDILPKGRPSSHATLPLGLPTRGVSIQLLDDGGAPVPPGEIGEICVKSEALALGYWNNPTQTAEVFYDQDQPERCYRTGDLGRLLPDGKLLHAGRKDFQVKIRGYRVDLPDIEANILSSGLVKDALVIGHRFESGQFRLIAYLVTAGSAPDPTATLRSYLLGCLPDYMVPAHFVVLESIPLLPSGKVDRSQLPLPDFSAGGNLEEPHSETETRLLSLWRELLNNPRIGLEDDFFSVGGDSLLANTMLAGVETLFDRRLPLSILAENNSVRKLSAILDQLPRNSQTLIVPINSNGSRPPLFAAPGGGGDALYFRNLTRYLDADQPVYGLQLIGDPEWRRSFPTTEEIAQVYLEEIRAKQPHGPYYLAGHSFGGYVILEIARHLRAAGEQVALLAFWDTIPPGPRRQAPIYDRVLIQFYNLRGLPFNEKVRYLLSRFEVITLRLTRFSFWTKLLRRTGYTPRTTLNASQSAKYRYNPPPYPGDAVLFNAKERHWYIHWDIMDTWPKYVTGNLQVITVPGDHNNLLEEPHVQILAREFSACLKKAQEKASLTSP